MPIANIRYWSAFAIGTEQVFCARGNGLPQDINLITVDAVRTAGNWEPEEQDGEDLGGELAAWQALAF